ncbi:hypothetical protein INS49_002103 [Diaporthe citri]|uniref:uncharacterized protein n=1 Tax=Diaporthe citri TaxID=83186 RepID=UPI001C81381C|nr:uncharacterized protein INS49_002103 [Diaporthe citri]KAG6367904.1 hypothetical protein INS49_002103 [Diaporthe citri]
MPSNLDPSSFGMSLRALSPTANMQAPNSSSLKPPVSDPPSPSSDGGAKSSRSSPAQNSSLEFCQHEDDAAASRPTEASAQTSFETFASLSAQGAFSLNPFLGSQLGPAIGPSLFASLGTTEDIHHFVFRSVTQMMGDQLTAESIVRYYFGTVNTWFTIVERSGFEPRFGQMWTEPSAETGLLALSMLLIVRAPEDTPGVSMQNSLYHSIKTLCGLVAAKEPMSIPLLQANLLVCLYELCHFMPQQAYMTLGSCVTISRAFGWLSESFWRQDQWIVRPRVLKAYSIIWWSMMFLESGIQAEELGFPRSVPVLDFQVPFPEHLDPFLPLSQNQQYGGSTQRQVFRFADDGDDKIDTIVFPEAKSTSMLLQVLQRTSGQAGMTGASRESLTNAMMDHARHIVSTPWKDSSRFAALSLTYTAILKLNHPYVGIASPGTTHDAMDRAAIQTTLPVIESICHSARLMSSSGSLSFLGPLVPPMAYSVFLGAMILIRLGDVVMHDPEWPSKVQLLRGCLEVFAKRWKIAEKHLQALNAAFQTHLNQLHPR